MKSSLLRTKCVGTGSALAEQPISLTVLITMGGNGDPATQTGIAIHLYTANRSMSSRFFYTAMANSW